MCNYKERYHTQAHHNPKKKKHKEEKTVYSSTSLTAPVAKTTSWEIKVMGLLFSLFSRVFFWFLTTSTKNFEKTKMKQNIQD